MGAITSPGFCRPTLPLLLSAQPVRSRNHHKGAEKGPDNSRRPCIYRPCKLRPAKEPHPVFHPANCHPANSARYFTLQTRLSQKGRTRYALAPKSSCSMSLMILYISTIDLLMLPIVTIALMHDDDKILRYLDDEQDKITWRVEILFSLS